MNFISIQIGSGKSTLLKRLFAEFPETFGFRYIFIIETELSITCREKYWFFMKFNLWINNLRKRQLLNAFSRENWCGVRQPIVSRVKKLMNFQNNIQSQNNSLPILFICLRFYIIQSQCIAHNAKTTTWRRKWSSLSFRRKGQYERSHWKGGFFGNSWIQWKYVWNKVSLF